MSHHVSVQGLQLSLPEAGFGIFDLETGLWGPIGPWDSAVDILQDWEDEDSNAAEFFLVVSISAIRCDIYSKHSLSVQDSGDEAIIDFEQARGQGARGPGGQGARGPWIPCWHPPTGDLAWYLCHILSFEYAMPPYTSCLHLCVLSWFEKWFPTTISWS